MYVPIEMSVEWCLCFHFDYLNAISMRNVDIFYGNIFFSMTKIIICAMYTCYMYAYAILWLLIMYIVHIIHSVYSLFTHLISWNEKNRNIYSSVLIDKLNWIGLYSVNTIYLPNNKIYSNQYLHCNCIWFSSTTNKLLAVLYRRQWTGIYEWRKNIWMSRKMKDFKRIVSFEEKNIPFEIFFLEKSNFDSD